MGGSKQHSPPYQGADWNQRLAGIVLAHQVSNPDDVRRSWYAAIFRNIRHWPEKRLSRISENPYQDCLAFVEESGGSYCEGMVLTPDMVSPEPGIWALQGDAVICFTHDIEGPSGLQGIPFDKNRIYQLRWNYDIVGPYLFTPEPVVMNLLAPIQPRRPAHRPLQVVRSNFTQQAAAVR